MKRRLLCAPLLRALLGTWRNGGFLSLVKRVHHAWLTEAVRTHVGVERGALIAQQWAPRNRVDRLLPRETADRTQPTLAMSLLSLHTWISNLALDDEGSLQYYYTHSVDVLRTALDSELDRVPEDAGAVRRGAPQLQESAGCNALWFSNHKT